MNSEEADALVVQIVQEQKLQPVRDAIARLQVEARFYLSPEWNEYRDQVLEPRYREATAQLVSTDETATILRAQGEARALRYQIDRSESAVRELEEKKKQYADMEQKVRAAAG